MEVGTEITLRKVMQPGVGRLQGDRRQDCGRRTGAVLQLHARLIASFVSATPETLDADFFCVRFYETEELARDYRIPEQICL